MEQEALKIKRIIWPVDAAEEVDKTQSNIVDTLNILARQSGRSIEVEPVYVIPAAYVMPPDMLEYSPPIDLKDEAFEVLYAKLEKVDIPGLLPPQVLEEPVYTTTQTAQVLIEYAQETNADLIAIASHAKKGLARLFLGSFTEAMILHSPVPVLTVNPHAKAPQKFDHILFPTDFEKESRAIFPNVLNFAREFGARVTVFHMLFEPFALTPGMQAIAVQKDYLDEARAVAQRRAQDLIEQAREAGVAVEFLVLTSDEAVSSAIIKYAKKKDIQMIAMAARSGRIATLLTGSVTRQVVRASPYPVWVLREKAVTKASSKRPPIDQKEKAA